MPRDYLATVRQTLPRLALVVRHLRPTFHIHDVSALSPEFFAAQDVEGVIWDVDGTIMTYHAMEIADEFRPTLRQLFRDDGPPRHAILSNCDEERFLTLGHIFPEIPVLRGYDTASGPVFRRRLRGRDTHTAEDLERLFAAGARQIRKPNGPLVRYAMGELGVEDPSRVVMVGDQYFTDVASANLAGVRSVKVRTFGRETFPRSIRFTQRLEAMVYRLAYGRPPSR